jgi:uncharacterized hydantoinase/oxoprolinase family protein
MADVHRLLGHIPEGADAAPTVDGRAKTPEATRARLARLVGRDLTDASPAQWDALAAFFARAQLRRIEDAVALLGSDDPGLLSAPLVGAGVGRSVVARYAASEKRAYRDFGEFLLASPEVAAAAADCAPACAVALLLAGRTGLS